MAAFEYDSINLARPAFRLARLLAGSSTDIQCEIFQAWFDQPEDIMPYEALSYTWGDTVKTDKIKVNACEFDVTQNLYLALQYLRLENEDRILWIDGLCIDQMNDKEKGHQVQQMGNIYRQAERVVIWLGPADYDTDFLMDSMKQLEKESINYSRNNWRSLTQAWRDIRSNVQPKLRNIPPDVEFRQRNGLESLFQRPWFSRVWILQEVANARRAIVVCGVKSVSARTFAIVPSLIGVAPPPHCQSILDIMPGPLREESWWSQNQDLRTLLLKFGKTTASDPRDNIYALLGLSSDACDSDLLRADYSKSVQEVIKDVVSFLLRCPELHDTNFLSDYTMPQFLEISGSLIKLALSWAESARNKPLLKALLAHDYINANSKDDSDATLLLLAVQTKCNLLAELLLEHEDIDVNLKDKDERTPLIVAVQARHGEIVKILLSHGNIDMNLKDKDESTPLIVAAEAGYGEIVEILLSHSKIDVNLEDKDKRTPLIVAVQARHGEIVKMLLLHSNIDVNLRDKRKRTPLMVAVQYELAKIIWLLLSHSNIDVNLKDEDERTPLIEAVQFGLTEIIELLLSHIDIDVNLKDKHKRTPLMVAVAVQAGNKRITEILLSQSNIDVNLQDKSGDTALHLATNFPTITSLVLAHDDIKVNLKNTLGHTALQKAEIEGYWEVVELMNGTNKEKIRQNQDF
ncbi:ankyrin repeat-containing domain protein, partial [Hyaloscypha sp. PMI_1271]